jgi:hypothetical protein
MITMPQTPITDHSFKKWGATKIEENDGESDFYYWILPLPLEDDDVSDRPTLISIASDEWKNMELNEGEYLVTLFDNLPMLETEEEIELLYKILTKENLTK